MNSISELIKSMKSEAVATSHPKYNTRLVEWTTVRDCMDGETAIKLKGEKYLPRPEGMSGKYSKSYDAYKERAHFPLICPYALQGALGVIINKLPEFKVPPQLEYILTKATKDGRSLKQLFMDCVVENFVTGRVPLLVDVIDDLNEFRFVDLKAESLINWKSTLQETTKSIMIAVVKGASLTNQTNLLSNEYHDSYSVLYLEPKFKDGRQSFEYRVAKFDIDKTSQGFSVEEIPNFMGKTIDEIPLIMAGSINNSFDIQPIPLIPVANCSVKIYRKEADLSNSEFLSCNPTLVVVGASSKEQLPNVVGSSVMMVIPNELARVFYTQTDTAALTHVLSHIKDLYEEAIRHGVAILDARKGVEAAEALRIRQATQSSSLYSIYISVMGALLAGLKIMCKWGGYDESKVVADAPTSLTFGIPDSAIIKEIVSGFALSGVIPLDVVHRYLVSSGLLEQTVSYEDYIVMLEESKKHRESFVPKPPKEPVEGEKEEKEGEEKEGEEDDKSKKKPEEDTEE